MSSDILSELESQKSNSKNSSENNNETDIFKLQKGLEKLLENFNYKSYNVLLPIFNEYEDEIISLVNNIKKFNQSDVLISYDKNNFIIKIFLNNYLRKNFKGKYVKITFNAYIHKNEDYVLKKICESIGINMNNLKGGYDVYEKKLTEYYNNKNHKNNNFNKNYNNDYDENEKFHFDDEDDDYKNHNEENEKLIVIYYENIEYLVLKKKQILLYSLLELINNSNNILLIGLTNHYNLMDSMEKRVRSRFSQKTKNFSIKNSNKIFSGIQYYFTQNNIITNYEQTIFFYNCLISNENSLFIILIDRYVKLGFNVIYILTKIKYIISLFNLKLKEYIKQCNENDYNLFTINKEKIFEFLTEIINEIYIFDEQGSYYNLLLKFPKLHLTIFICFLLCVKDYNENITLNMIYDMYYRMVFKNNILIRKSKLDITLVRKYLEEFYNSNLIGIVKNEKYGNIYQLKMGLYETVKLVKSLESQDENILDEDMKRLLNKFN